MSVIKDHIISIIKNMPEESTVDDIMAELYFKQQVDTGLKQLENGQFLSHNQVKEQISKWLK